MKIKDGILVEEFKNNIINVKCFENPEANIKFKSIEDYEKFMNLIDRRYTVIEENQILLIKERIKLSKIKDKKEYIFNKLKSFLRELGYKKEITLESSPVEISKEICNNDSSFWNAGYGIDTYFNIRISEDNTSHLNEIKFLRDGELYKVSSIINIVTSDNIYDVNELSKRFYWLNSSNIAYVWDDYNKCMHPTSLIEEAKRIIEFAKKDYQWLVFTNSLFFIKELKLLAKKENLDVEYFNIYLNDHELEVERSDDLYSLNNLSLMNESISQFYREIDVYNPLFID